MTVINTDINAIDSGFNADIVDYDDGTLASLISKANAIETNLNTLAGQINGLGSHDINWKGDSQTKYNELKTFLQSYSEAYNTSISELSIALSGLQTLLGSIPSSNLMKSIDDV